VNDSVQAIEGAITESSEKIAVVEQLLREFPSIAEQNRRLNHGFIETRPPSIVINET
jgi:hypothetical protein